MANEKRLIDANAINEKCKATKIIAVFPEWKDLPLPAKKASVRMGAYIKKIVQEAPTVDAVEVVHGRWNPRPYHKLNSKGKLIKYCDFYFCSECGTGRPIVPPYNYCPNCGAKMDGDGNG